MQHRPQRPPVAARNEADCAQDLERRDLRLDVVRRERLRDHVDAERVREHVRAALLQRERPTTWRKCAMIWVAKILCGYARTRLLDAMDGNEES